MDKENNLTNKTKPFLTKKERILYTKIMIDEAIKQNNMELAVHYKKILEMLEKDDNSRHEKFKALRAKK